jgi:hypothetical protein
MLFSYYDTNDGNVIAEVFTQAEAEDGSIFTEEEIAEIKEISREANEEIYKETTTEAKFDFHTDFEALKDSFSIMGRGMLGIFGVTITIVIVVAIMNKLLSGKK